MTERRTKRMRAKKVLQRDGQKEEKKVWLKVQEKLRLQMHVTSEGLACQTELLQRQPD